MLRAMPDAGRSRLRALHRALGIPATYRKERHLPWQSEARRLVTVALAADDGQPVRLAPRAAAAWERMCAAATRDGITLLPLSGFRSVARQVEIVRAKLAAGETLAEILQLVAAPGCSEHHTGRAIDVGSSVAAKLDTSFARTAAFRWLKAHAARFGFRLSYPPKNVHGIAYEPWHWCWRA